MTSTIETTWKIGGRPPSECDCFSDDSSSEEKKDSVVMIAAYAIETATGTTVIRTAKAPRGAEKGVDREQQGERR
jgi:hypothetical protein